MLQVRTPDDVSPPVCLALPTSPFSASQAQPPTSHAPHCPPQRPSTRLKLDPWKRYEFDRDGYAEAKTAFVTAHTRTAKEERRTRQSPESAIVRNKFTRREKHAI